MTHRGLAFLSCLLTARKEARPMRLEHCIRRWLGLSAHRVRSVEETDDCLVAEIEAVEGRLPRCGHCGRKVRRTKGRMKRRLWRDLKIRKLPLVLAYTARRVVRRLRVWAVSLSVAAECWWSEGWRRRRGLRVCLCIRPSCLPLRRA